MFIIFLKIGLHGFGQIVLYHKKTFYGIRIGGNQPLLHGNKEIARGLKDFVWLSANSWVSCDVINFSVGELKIETSL
jgi:hypothetical protein